ncbi:MAG TPA: LacI family DNA-binding transcriptional regulator [Amnibacterium sp.]
MSATDGGDGSRRAPTLRDVAGVAGVSYQTVSRFLNRPDSVSQQTAGRVQSAIDDLGYVPNEAARALRLGALRMRGAAAPASS